MSAENSGTFGSASAGRLLAYEKHAGTYNMACDEAILNAVALGQQPATLRFYGWTKPTLSLGYFQSLSDAMGWCDETSGHENERREIGLIRRSTGGGAILHDQEMTYSIALPVHDNHHGAREVLYQASHAAVATVLSRHRVSASSFRSLAEKLEQSSTDKLDARNDSFLCFQRRTAEDLICSGYKVLGSAQRRTRGGVLQHGSLLLSVSAAAPSLPGISEMTGTRLEAAAVADQLAGELSRRLGIEWKLGKLSEAEHEAQAKIAADRYASSSWTERR